MKGLRARRIVTCDETLSSSSNELGVIEDGAILFNDKEITWVGPSKDAPSGVPLESIGDRIISPGLIDSHTHAAWVGSRHNEYAMRMAGADYRAIASAGGGILSSHREIVAASEETITDTLRSRLVRMGQMGVTTIEVKSGYGLTLEDERKQLRAIHAVRGLAGLPYVVPTFLALHAIPESLRANRDHYVLRMATELLAEVKKNKWADFVDAYLDRDAFSVDEGRLLGESARIHGMGLRLHVGQFVDIGGAELAAELGAASVDHVEQISDAGIAALAKARVCVTLLPVASFTLGQAPPPVAKLRAAGVTLVVASDSNPGTAPTESLPLAMALAVRNYGLSPNEAFLAATRNAAKALRLYDVPKPRGVLRKGAHADLVVWDLPHETALIQPWGVSRALRVFRDGKLMG